MVGSGIGVRRFENCEEVRELDGILFRNSVI